MKKSKVIALLTVAAVLISPTFATGDVSTPPQPILKEVVVPLSLEDAWDQWTLPAGLQSFFAREAIVEPHVLGEYSIHFFPEGEPGQRGAEDMRILAFEPGDRLTFTWNAPPHLPLARAQMAVVEITFDAVSETRTRVTLRHDHFGRNADAKLARAYFNAAWPVVLARSVYAAINGPIDWDNPPPDLMLGSLSREQLAEMAAQQHAQAD